jgi:hypothetical protein
MCGGVDVVLVFDAGIVWCVRQLLEKQKDWRGVGGLYAVGMGRGNDGGTIARVVMIAKLLSFILQ